MPDSFSIDTLKHDYIDKYNQAILFKIKALLFLNFEKRQRRLPLTLLPLVARLYKAFNIDSFKIKRYVRNFVLWHSRTFFKSMNKHVFPTLKQKMLRPKKSLVVARDFQKEIMKSPAASYVQRWALCSNSPANV